jgi:hypothetical protein
MGHFRPGYASRDRGPGFPATRPARPRSGNQARPAGAAPRPRAPGPVPGSRPRDTAALRARGSMASGPRLHGSAPAPRRSGPAAFRPRAAAACAAADGLRGGCLRGGRVTAAARANMCPFRSLACAFLDTDRPLSVLGGRYITVRALCLNLRFRHFGRVTMILCLYRSYMTLSTQDNHGLPSAPRIARGPGPRRGTAACLPGGPPRARRASQEHGPHGPGTRARHAGLPVQDPPDAGNTTCLRWNAIAGNRQDPRDQARTAGPSTTGPSTAVPQDPGPQEGADDGQHAAERGDHRARR